jgi:hypothetical protein
MVVQRRVEYLAANVSFEAGVRQELEEAEFTSLVVQSLVVEARES